MPMPECTVRGRGLKPATMEIFLRVTLRVALDDTHESAENVPRCIARQSEPVDDVGVFEPT